ncbi:MAG: protoporphyrinogen oxidase [Deltaproteobacteria bacterium]|nr:protoporphyrinogen oxidase [Deltaproteobacteria bacterium]
MADVVIIGGGISGLATAFAVEREARKQGLDISTLILEKGTRPGGKIWSRKEDGYLCEWGPNGFLDSKPWTLDLCRDTSITARLLRSNDNARKRFIFSQGRLHQLPDSAQAFFSSGLISWPGKLRLSCELLIPPRRDGHDETLADFARRRLGAEALEKLIGPMVSGVFAGDPETMSLKSCFPRIHELETEYGGLIKALFKLQKKRRLEKKSGKPVAGPSGPGGVLTSFYGGIDELISGVAGALTGEIRTQARVTGLRKEIDGFEIDLEGGRILQAVAVVSACPAYELAAMVEKMDREMARILNRIPYAPLSVVCCGFARGKIPHDLNGFGYLAVRGEKMNALGTLWDSSIFPNRAPQGCVLLRSMVGGATRPEVMEWSEEKVQTKVLEDLRTSMGIDRKPDFIRVYPHEKAIPQYLSGHGKLIDGLADRARYSPGFFFTGNAFFGVGLNDCVKAANETAAKVVDFIGHLR